MGKSSERMKKKIKSQTQKRRNKEARALVRLYGSERKKTKNLN